VAELFRNMGTVTDDAECLFFVKKLHLLFGHESLQERIASFWTQEPPQIE
jgi:hypothetical protein